METAATGKNSVKPHKKKANKHKSRNDFSDVQRIEMNPTAALGGKCPYLFIS